PERGFVAVPAVAGASLDVDALADALAALAATPTAADATLTFRTTAVEPDVTTREARAAAISARWMSSSALGLRGGDNEFELAATTVAGLLTFGTQDGAFGPIVDEAALAALLEPFAAQVLSEPTNAGFTWNANGIAAIVPGSPGRELNVSGSVAAVVDALEGRAGGSLTPAAGLAINVTPPALTTEAAEAAAAKMGRLATWTTYYQPGEGNYWGANISIPAQDINGLVLAPGEWFDFWDDIGEVSTARGYGYGGVILNGRSIPNGALAGGICSTSTTLFNAAMRAGLEIGDRRNHSYYIERYPVGLDATVFQTDTYEVNMTFRNDTADPVVIRSYTGTGYVRFDIWGVPDGRTVSLSAPITSNHRTARETTVVNNNLAPGTSRRVEYPHNGFDSVVTRTVRAADGEVIWTNTWHSAYRTVNGITEVGPKPAAPPSTPAPTPTPAP
ncbi:MAG: VanW family protein, partial [Candidatus Limnocylindria bacterium]